MRNFIGQMGKTGLLPVKATGARKRLLVEFDFGQSGGVEEGRREQAAGVLVEVVSCRSLRSRQRRARIDNAKQANLNSKINNSKVERTCSETASSNREDVAFAEETTWKWRRSTQRLLRFLNDWLQGVINGILQHA